MCVEACKQRLLCLEPKAIPWPTALAMLHLPPGLREGEAFGALTEVRGWLAGPGWQLAPSRTPAQPSQQPR